MSNNHSRRMHHPRFQNWKKSHASRPTFMSGWNYPPVNVLELDEKYELSVYASGYDKADISIDVVKDTLIISAEQKNDDSGSFGWRRREFATAGFERKFGLPEGVDVDGIAAKYSDGILEITLPKLSGFETKRTSVEVG